MDMNFRRYPIGIQNFELLRNDNYVYVDKTPLVYKLANTNTTYFLSRPPTFWKKSADIHTRGLFPRKERIVQRTGNGNSGKGMDSVSGNYIFAYTEIYM